MVRRGLNWETQVAARLCPGAAGRETVLAMAHGHRQLGGGDSGDKGPG